MVQQKDSAKVKQQRREMAQLIEVRYQLITIDCRITPRRRKATAHIQTPHSLFHVTDPNSV
jgi:hypothetical protein